MSNPSEPTVLGQLSGFDHICEAVVQEGLAYLVTDYCRSDYYNGQTLMGQMQIMSVSEPKNMGLVGSLELPGIMETIAVLGNYAYVANGDVLVVDVSDPSRPQLVTTITTPGYASDLLTADGLLYVADQAGGLLVIQPFE